MSSLLTRVVRMCPLQRRLRASRLPGVLVGSHRPGPAVRPDHYWPAMHSVLEFSNILHTNPAGNNPAGQVQSITHLKPPASRPARARRRARSANARPLVGAPRAYSQRHLCTYGIVTRLRARAGLRTGRVGSFACICIQITQPVSARHTHTQAQQPHSTCSQLVFHRTGTLLLVPHSLVERANLRTNVIYKMRTRERRPTRTAGCAFTTLGTNSSMRRRLPSDLARDSATYACPYSKQRLRDISTASNDMPCWRARACVGECVCVRVCVRVRARTLLIVVCNVMLCVRRARVSAPTHLALVNAHSPREVQRKLAARRNVDARADQVTRLCKSTER
jgi:hypothetical protein